MRRSLFWVILLGGLVLAPPALAAPPTLAGEGWSGVLANPSGAAFGCQENADGGLTVTIPYAATASDGPYPGTFRDRLEFKLSEPRGFGERVVLAVSGEFIVDSSVGQVSATLRLDPAASGPVQNVAAGDCSTGVQYLYAGMRYTATIVTPEGVFVDRGRSGFRLDQYRYNYPLWNASHGFGPSDLSAPEQNESVLFGQRTPGGSFSAMSANTKRASPFTLFAPATVRKVYAYVDGRGATSGSQAIRAVLYRNSGGLPAAYVTRSFDFTVPAGMSARWVPLYLAPPAQLNPGVYWIGIQSGATNGVARFAWNSKPNARRFNVDTFADGSSDPFGSALVDDQQLSVFAAGSY